MENAALYEHSIVPKRITLSYKFTIGRSLDNSYVVEDINVSRRHCVFEFKDSEWVIFDKSSNGTWLNESLISKNLPHKLSDGDVIKLSDSCKYTFKILTPSELSPRIYTEEEIANVAEEVVASADAFNSDFQLEDCGGTNAVKSENQVAPSGNKQISKTTILAESDIVPQPSTSNDQVIGSVVINEASASGNVPKCSLEFVEDELQCSICTEMFIKAVTLSCSHTFCSYCIAQWQRTKTDCPICRKKITTKCPTLILDNYIDKVVNTADDEFKRHRQEIIAQREAAVKHERPQPQGSTVLEGPSMSNPRVVLSITSFSVPPAPDTSGSGAIDISSDEGDYDYDFNMSDNSGSDWDDYNSDGSSPRPYYGGYGRCYSCGNRGHWANSCPNRRR